MNAKMPNRKTKSASTRISPKAAPATRTSPKPPLAATASSKALKSASTRQVRTTLPSSAAPRVHAAPVGKSKQARLIAMLHTAPGATIDQMMALTGWQAHTVRGTISGALRKKLRLNVTCAQTTDSGARLYRIVSPAVRA